jgi:phosphoribosylanthranilate isomerase
MNEVSSGAEADKGRKDLRKIRNLIIKAKKIQE